jgi:hypothetical protein
MSDKPKRKFWQFHVWTLLLTTFAIAGLFWLNFRERVVCEIDEDEGGNIRLTSIDRGWPFRASFRTTNIEFRELGTGKWKSQRLPVAGIAQSGANELSAVLDAGVGSFSALLFAAISEWLIRRRDAHKT